MAEKEGSLQKRGVSYYDNKKEPYTPRGSGVLPLRKKIEAGIHIMKYIGIIIMSNARVVAMIDEKKVILLKNIFP